MIQANEVRIGNLLLSGGVVVTIDARSIFNIWDVSKKYDPIPITPEWLERLGFEFEDTLSFSEYFNKSHGNIKAFIIDSVWFCSRFDWMCHKEHHLSHRGWCVGRRNTNNRYNGWNYDESAEVKYIHQLQNLYFALTGTELTTRSR